MKLLILTALASLSLVSISSQAAIGDVEGKSNCTIITSLDNKLAKEAPCSYKGVVEASMRHTLSHIQYDLATGEVFETIEDSTFNFDKKGAMAVLTSPTSVNDIPAKIIYVRANTYDLVPEIEMRDRHKVDEATFPDVLHCFKLKEHNEAFCVPYDLAPLIS